MNIQMFDTDIQNGSGKLIHSVNCTGCKNSFPIDLLIVFLRKQSDVTDLSYSDTAVKNMFICMADHIEKMIGITECLEGHMIDCLSDSVLQYGKQSVQISVCFRIQREQEFMDFQIKMIVFIFIGDLIGLFNIKILIDQTNPLFIKKS